MFSLFNFPGWLVICKENEKDSHFCVHTLRHKIYSNYLCKKPNKMADIDIMLSHPENNDSLKILLSEYYMITVMMKLGPSRTNANFLNLVIIIYECSMQDRYHTGALDGTLRDINGKKRTIWWQNHNSFWRFQAVSTSDSPLK